MPAIRHIDIEMKQTEIGRYIALCGKEVSVAFIVNEVSFEIYKDEHEWCDICSLLLFSYRAEK